ncbi:MULTISPECIES: GerMN domain-containing protein [unclassified Nostoc]|uniref:GerMN domain-containing protein n=1 Tax=unclassified Nostoc TaxID=2593658 RepID=UPI0013CFED66|nr:MULTISPECIES: GerMN domain-containing protein [unclassified Nostoc]MBE9001667.1 GerMN domain-containing protein [Nostoc sp. LEGE 12447]NEU81715.1 sporulation/spore germination protein [Nostoc sp. UIC 10630]
MSKIMNTTKRYFLPLIFVTMVVSLSSCSSNPTARKIDSPTPYPTTTPTNTVSSQTSSQIPSVAQLREKSPNQESPKENTPSSSIPKAVTSKTTDVTLYTSDTQCQEFIPEKVSVPAEEPVTNVVSKILEKRDTSDFSLSGYRVNIKNGVATVDLRISPESKRQIASLSSCEQFALFGSLRKTLTSNSQWNIKEVRFTERGEDIVL